MLLTITALKKMNKVTKLIFIIFILAGVYACQIRDLNYSTQVVEKIEIEKQEQFYQRNHWKKNEWVRRTSDSLYSVYFKYRRDKVNKFIEKHGFNNFVMDESYFIGHSNVLIYVVGIFTQDSVYYFTYNYGLKHLKKYEYGIVDNTTKVFAQGSIYYTKRKDSIFIYRNAYFKDYIYSPSYYSNYVNGKLDQLTYGDSIIYKKRESKMVVDLKRLKGFYVNEKQKKMIEYK